MEDYGFIILRCVKHNDHRYQWIECYNCIRKLYDNKIIIIDDASDKQFIDDVDLVNVDIIESEFPGKRELLPYYYFHKLKPFRQAIILHDTAFIQNKLDIESTIHLKFLWHFPYHFADNAPLEKKMLSHLNHGDNLLNFYDELKWHGCFGVMSAISHDYICHLEYKYDLFKLMDFVNDRDDAKALERVFAVLCFHDGVVNLNDCSILRDIHEHIYGFHFTFDHYKWIKNHHIIKVWTGR